MAIIKSAIMTSGSGSIGGLNITRNRYAGIVFRSKSMPVNPNSPEQVLTRVAMDEEVGRWEGEIPYFRNSWDDYASTLTLLNKQGDPYTPTGRNTFLSWAVLVNYLVARGLIPAITNWGTGTQPGALVAPAPVLQAPTSVDTGIEVEVTNNTTHDLQYYVTISPILNNAKNFYKGPYTPSTGQILVVAASATVAIEFLGLIEDAKYGISLRPYTIDAEVDKARVAPLQHLQFLAITTSV